MTRFNPETIAKLAGDGNTLEIVIICTEELKRLAMLDQANGHKLVRRYAAAKKYIEKTDDNRPGLKGVFDQKYQGKDCQGLCNGYTGVILYVPIEGLPGVTGEPFNLSNIISGVPEGYEEIEVDYPAVVAMTKGHGKHEIPIYGIGQQVFDPHMITDVIPILGEGCKFFVSGKDDYAPMYVTNDNGIGIVLPCRK